jgi:hypothetical protein
MTNEPLSYELIDERAMKYEWDFSYATDWEIALPLTESEQENREFAPLMDFVYPLGIDFKVPEDFRDRLVNMTIIRIGDRDLFLALTGGGMDMTWDICQTYINLGYYPPVEFCRLPAMAGRGSSSNDQVTIGRCNDALKAMIIRCQSRIDENLTLLPEGDQSENKRHSKTRAEPCQITIPPAEHL